LLIARRTLFYFHYKGKKTSPYVKILLRNSDAPYGFGNTEDWNTFTNYQTNAQSRKEAATNAQEVANVAG
jgi:hypothetical protein